MNFRKVLMYLGFLGIGVLLFYMAFSMVEDREALWNDMRSASWGGLIVSFIMGYLAIVSRGLRWGITAGSIWGIVPMSTDSSSARR